MADSKRLAILKAMTTHLKGVTVANGFQHDLDSSIYRGRASFGSSDKIPMVSILEYLRQDLREDRPSNSNTVKEDWQLLLQGWAEDDRQNPTDPVHLLLADVKKSLAMIRDDKNPAYRLGGLIVDLKTDGGIVRPPDENSNKAQFYLRVTLAFVEYTDDPYKLSK